MRLYNTLSRQIEEIAPITPPEITLYTCGPTVYDYPHIGNWFTFIRYDLLVRTLKSSGYEPKWVMNITDVGHLSSDADEGEDKLASRAKKEGKNAWEVAAFYSDYFNTALCRLNFTTPWQLPKATEHIDEQINFIKSLEQKGYTYQISDGVYYDTAKFPAYADFARLDLDEQQAGARVGINPQKRNPTDFALWKLSPEGSKRDMEWDSPWGRGFPGWHIECSAMCLKFLGETVDIHAGGIDHVPIHHTNEIAQSQALTGQPLANIWMHTNHILINDEKISKSLGNSITLEDVEKHGFSLEAFRLHVLESSYRSQSKFNWDSLGAAASRLLRYKNLAVLRFQLNGKENVVLNGLREAMQDDLNTPLALAKLEEFIGKVENSDTSRQSIENAVTEIDSLFGLKLAETSDITDEQKDLIRQREQARSAKDFTRADNIRNRLTEANIGLNDMPSGPIWSYLN